MTFPGPRNSFPFIGFQTRPRPRILFLHGWSSDGWKKSSYLRSLGYDVMCPRLTSWSFRRAAATAQDAFDSFQPKAIVGSSRGAAIALWLDAGKTPLVLLAPPWRAFGVDPKLPTMNAIVIHSPNDSFVPISDSEELCRLNPGVRLVAAGLDHRMNDEGAKKALGDALAVILAAGESPMAVQPRLPD